MRATPAWTSTPARWPVFIRRWASAAATPPTTAPTIRTTRVGYGSCCGSGTKRTSRSGIPTFCRAAELVAACPDDPALLGPTTFSAARWSAFLACKGIPWPRLPSGALALDDDTFREMARAYPADVAADPGIATCPISAAAAGAGRRVGRPRPLFAVGVRLQNGSQSAEQQPFHLRAVRLAASPISGAGSGRGLRRLERAGIRHRRRAVRRRRHAGGLLERRPLPGVRQAGRCRSG